MEKQNFVTVVDEVSKELEQEGYIVQMREMFKNNVKKVGLVVKRPDKNVGKIFYLDILYDMFGLNENDIAEDVIAHIRAEMNERDIDVMESNLPMVLGYVMMKENIIMCVMNKEKNEEFLKTIPYREVLDLAVYYRYILPAADELKANFVITNKIMKSWKITEQELYDAAKKNETHWMPSIKKVSTVLKEVLENQDDFWGYDEEPLFVVNTDYMLYGASVMVNENAMKLVEKKFGKFYILPSSIHEILVIPAGYDKETKSQFDLMVQEVNKNLPPEEVLVDHAYYYNYGYFYM